jgi:hypothetical protein
MVDVGISLIVRQGGVRDDVVWLCTVIQAAEDVITSEPWVDSNDRCNTSTRRICNGRTYKTESKARSSTCIALPWQTAGREA